MNLLDIRKQFVKVTGRYDLITNIESYDDNGANYYINEGIRWLNKLIELPNSRAKLYYKLTSGSYSVIFNNSCRLVSEVYVNDSENRFRLDKINLTQLRSYYTKTIGETDVGVPYQYALADLRTLESALKNSLGTFIDTTLNSYDDFYSYAGLIIVPPVDKDYIVEVSGLFRPIELFYDQDENYWTIEESSLLIRAAMYQLKALSTSNELITGLYKSIMLDISQIDNDIVQESNIDINQMDG